VLSVDLDREARNLVRRIAQIRKRRKKDLPVA
jgi:hypothetical protein